MYASKIKGAIVFFGLGLANLDAHFKKENSSREHERGQRQINNLANTLMHIAKLIILTNAQTIWPLLPRCIVDKGKLKKSGENKEDTGAVPNVWNNIIR